MDAILSQLPGFLAGLGLGSILLKVFGKFLTGFLGDAAERVGKALAARMPWTVKPAEQVGTDFDPVRYPPGSCAWVADGQKHFDYRQRGWTHYRKTKRGGDLFMISGERYGQPVKEWLMVNPSAVEILPANRK